MNRDPTGQEDPQAPASGPVSRPVSRPALALYQPDIAGNTGTLIRLAACMACELHVIHPAGFRMDDRALARAGMDYRDLATLHQHDDFAAFEAWRANTGRRLVLMSVRAQATLDGFAFQPGDILLLGRESSGVPQDIHDMAGASVRIEMAEGARSLNQALTGAIGLWEAVRQLG